MVKFIEETQAIESVDTPFSDIRFSVLLIGISLLLALFKTQFVPSQAIGLGTILLYMIALVPLIYLIVKNQIINRYTLFALPFILIWCIDIFIYNNTLVHVFFALYHRRNDCYFVCNEYAQSGLFLSSLYSKTVDLFFIDLIPENIYDTSLFV